MVLEHNSYTHRLRRFDTMPVCEIRCPSCGAESKMGLPRDATVTAVRESEEDRDIAGSDQKGIRDTDTHSQDTKLRRISCPNGHVFAVVFTVS